MGTNGRGRYLPRYVGMYVCTLNTQYYVLLSVVLPRTEKTQDSGRRSNGWIDLLPSLQIYFPKLLEWYEGNLRLVQFPPGWWNIWFPRMTLEFVNAGWAWTRNIQVQETDLETFYEAYFNNGESRYLHAMHGTAQAICMQNHVVVCSCNVSTLLRISPH